MASDFFSVSDVLSWTGGRLVNESALSRSVSEIRAKGVSVLARSTPEHIAFFFSKNYQHEIPSARAGILVTGEAFVGPLEKSGLPLWKNTAVIACKDPYLALALVSEKVAQGASTVSHLKLSHEGAAKIHPTAVVHETAKLGGGVQVGAHAVIEAGARIGAGTVVYANCFVGPDCEIGENCVLFPHVVLYERAQLGNRVRLHSGVVIGADGFGYAPRFEEGQIVEHRKIYHLGRVVIADDVEVGAGSTIDRGTIADTRIDRGAKIDNGVQIGHNSHVGEGAILCGMSGMAGSSKLGRFCYVGALAGLGNQVTVGDRTKLGPGTLVASSVGSDLELIGFPHRDVKEFYKMHALLNRLLKQRKANPGKGSENV